MLHVCNICDKKFVFKRDLDEHLKEAHVSVAQKFERAGSILDEWQAQVVDVDDDDPTVNEMLCNLEDYIRRVQAGTRLSQMMGYTSVVQTA